MKVKNINKPVKFKNLTLEKDYEAIEDGQVYVVTNDSGFRARYAKNYFRAVPDAHVSRNLLDLLIVSYKDDELTITLNRTVRTINLGIENSVISCGIDEIEGISILKRTVNEMYAAKMANVVGTKAEMFTAILNKIFEVLREDQDRMCWLVSDEIRVADETLDAVLTEMSDIHTDGINPNNNHNIRLWVIM